MTFHTALSNPFTPRPVSFDSNAADARRVRRSGARRSLRSGLIALTTTLALTGGTAQAEIFGVRVTNAEGKPLSGVAVCVGIQGNYKRYGTRFTDGSGTAVLDVPNVPLVVTVSKNRFTGTRMTEPARTFSLIKEVKLRDGVPGPRCKAESSMASLGNVPDLLIREIDISGSSSSRSLRPLVDGRPSHYRVSGNSEFVDQEWQVWTDEIMLSQALSGEKELFLQLRNRSGSDDAWVESVSDVITIVMPVS